MRSDEIIIMIKNNGILDSLAKEALIRLDALGMDLTGLQSDVHGEADKIMAELENQEAERRASGFVGKYGDIGVLNLVEILLRTYNMVLGKLLERENIDKVSPDVEELCYAMVTKVIIAYLIELGFEV